MREYSLGDCNDKVLEILMDFIYQLVNRGDLALAKVLRAKCIEKMDQRQNGIHSASVLLPSINVTTRQSSLCDFKSEHLAEQMTLLDSELFLKIEVIIVISKTQILDLKWVFSFFTQFFHLCLKNKTLFHLIIISVFLSITWILALIQNLFLMLFIHLI